MIKISKSVKSKKASEAVKEFLLKYDGLEINKPTRFLPNTEFLKYHNRKVFQAQFMRNVKFVYLYRDGANYKIWSDVVFENPDGLSLNEIDRSLRPYP